MDCLPPPLAPFIGVFRPKANIVVAGRLPVCDREPFAVVLDIAMDRYIPHAIRERNDALIREVVMDAG